MSEFEVLPLIITAVKMFMPSMFSLSHLSLLHLQASYPVRVRYAMMQLNRAVCLDYPETDVPWFHEKYCQQITSLGNTVYII